MFFHLLLLYRTWDHKILDVTVPSPQSSLFAAAAAALDMTESRLDLVWNAALRLCWCEEGRIKVVNARFTNSPSTPPIRTIEFAMADLHIFNLVEGNDDDVWLWPPLLETFLWRLHRNDPGCVVGEHIQVLLTLETGRFFLETITDRLGELERLSMKKRTEGLNAEDE